MRYGTLATPKPGGPVVDEVRVQREPAPAAQSTIHGGGRSRGLGRGRTRCVRGRFFFAGHLRKKIF